MNQLDQNDTIAAIATPPGVGGIAIVRVSGSRALPVIKKLISLKKLSKNKLALTAIYDLSGRQKIDQVVVAYFKAPDSYTGEDVVEINCHGSIYITNQILSETLKAGARLAKPGEFTKRAFLAGKIDLTQVEAVAEMIGAKTDLSAQLALRHLAGDVSRRIKSLRREFLKFYAECEASVDFPEEIPEPRRQKIIKFLTAKQKQLAELVAAAQKGILIKEGITVVIAGRTNVGKSSLFNYLVQANKAIVTDIHGTTRDALEAEINLQGIKVTLVDTAGIRRTKNKIELIGIEKSKEYVETAELVLYLIDAPSGFRSADQKVIDRIANKNLLYVINKTDLKPNYKFKNAVKISTKSGQGIKNLEEKILSVMDLKHLDLNKLTYISSLRQKEQLIKASGLIANCLEQLNRGQLLDVLAVDIKGILWHLGELTGDEVSEETVEHIFSNFCVGK